MNRLTNQCLDDIRSVLATERPAVAVSVVRYEQGDSTIDATAAAFKSIAKSISPLLAVAVEPRPFAWETWDSESWSPNEQATWERLGNELTVFVPQAPSEGYLPTLILALPMQRVREESSRWQLWERLRTHASRQSAIVVVLIDGEPATHEVDAWRRETWRLWLREVDGELSRAGAARCGIHFYLAGVTTATGERIGQQELGQAVAHALIADIAPRQRTEDRFLARTAGETRPSVSILGAAGHIASAETVAASLSRRLYGQWREEIQFGAEKGPEPAQASIPAAEELLTHAFDRQLPWGTRGHLAPADSSHAPDYDEPAIICGEKRFSVRFDDESIASRLERIPARLWKTRLSEWDALLTGTRVVQIAQRVEADLGQQYSKIEGHVVQGLGRMFARHLHREPLDRAAQRILDQLAGRRQFVMTGVAAEKAASDVVESMRRLDRKVAALAVWRQGAWTSAAALAVAIAMVWGTSEYVERAMWSWGFGAAGVLLAATILVAVARTIWAWREARNALEETLRKIMLRARASVLLRANAAVSRIYEQTDEDVRSATLALVEAVQSLSQPINGRDPLPLTASTLFEHPSEQGGEGPRTKPSWLLARLCDATMTEKFHERCVDLGEEIARGRVPPDQTTPQLLAFVENEVLLRLTGQIEVWRFFTLDGHASTFDESRWDESRGRWSRPLLLAGRESTKWFEEGEVETFWICPSAMASRVTPDARRRLLEMPDRVVALTRVGWVGGEESV